jgi:hypothetical protein
VVELSFSPKGQSSEAYSAVQPRLDALAISNSLWHDCPMPKRISKPEDTSDDRQNTHQVSAASIAKQVDAIPTEGGPSHVDISRIMAQMGRKGGQIGGKRRLQTMTPAQRRKVAKKAAAARWERQKDK